MRKFIPLLLSLLLLLTGCQTMLQKDSEKAISGTLKSYEASLRWGYAGQAYNFLRKDLAEKAKIPANLQNIKITDYKVIKRADLVAEDTASQMVVIGYVFEDEQIEKSLTDNQLWGYNKEKKTWSRINMIPEFK